MKALSLRPYWATEMLCGNKTIECRAWKTDYRGDLIICSSAKREPGCISGHALLICKLVSIEPFTKKHLKQAGMEEMPEKPSYAWILDDMRVIYPVPVKGKLHLFDLDIAPTVIPESITDEELCAIFDPLYA